jgi:ABC-type glycerol-3-phosphate transport system permease component
MTSLRDLPSPRDPRSGRVRLASLATVVLLGAFLLPLCWLVVCSLRPESELLGRPSAGSATIVFDHYRALFTERSFWLPIRNSLVVAASTTALCVTLGSLAAYALVRLPFRGRSVILGLVLAVSMFPQIAIVSPLYLLLRSMHLIDTFPGLILPYVTFSMPLAMWLLASYFRALPRELEDAAMVDGASRLRALTAVVLPLALPGVATTAILTFLYCWNEFLFALVFTLGPERQTVPVAVALFRGQYQVPWGEILAAAVVASLPVAAVVFAFQERIVAGLTAGGVKG